MSETISKTNGTLMPRYIQISWNKVISHLTAPIRYAVDSKRKSEIIKNTKRHTSTPATEAKDINPGLCELIVKMMGIEGVLLFY